MDMSLLKIPECNPGAPFLTTVNKMLAIGVTVATAPSATKVLTRESFAACGPRIIKEWVDVITP